MRLRTVPSFATLLVLALSGAAYAAPPTANAGDAQFAECVGGMASFQLSGSGEDPDNDPLPDGAAAPANPFATPIHPLHLAIDGETAQPLFAGLAPGQAGLLQVNVPTAGLAPGEHEVVLSILSAPSNGVKIYVRR